MSKYKIGQEVRRFEKYARVQDTEGTPGEIVKVSRTLLHVEIPVSSGRTEMYRMKDGVIADAFGHQYILTLPELTRKNRRAAAIAVINRGGLVFKNRSAEYTTDQLEMLAQTINQMGMG